MGLGEPNLNASYHNLLYLFCTKALSFYIILVFSHHCMSDINHLEAVLKNPTFCKTSDLSDEMPIYEILHYVWLIRRFAQLLNFEMPTFCHSFYTFPDLKWDPALRLSAHYGVKSINLTP